jgi:hypothetical protein
MPWLQTPVPFATGHCAAVVHWRGTHCPFRQVSPATQPDGSEHELWHVLSAQKYGEQFVCDCATLPCPSQTGVLIVVELAHVVDPAGDPYATNVTTGMPPEQVPVAQVVLAGTFVSSAAKPHVPLVQTACWQEPAAAAVQFAADSHCTHTPLEQWPLAQSAPPEHDLPSAQAGQPCWAPQTSAEQVGADATQMPPVQTPVAQSPPVAQCLPSTHFGQLGPPQSTSVSLPFWMPSVQVGAGGCWSVGCCCCCCCCAGVHVPATHVSPPAQRWPQRPQLCSSVLGLMQRPPQTLWGLGQMQWCLPFLVLHT